MKDAMPDMNRRDLLGGGLLLGMGLVLSACNRAQKHFVPLTQEELDGPPHILPPESPPRALAASVPAPSGVMSRREWTSAGPIQSLINPMNGINRITVHHSAVISSSVRSKADAARMLTSIRNGHLAQGWADIGYHYIIDPQGRIWEGRSIRYQGAHVKNNNEHNLGVMMMGNFDVERPTPEALSSLDGFLADRMRAYNVPIRRVFTHQEITSTECPGRNLQGYMVATRSSSGRLARA
jgi:hypothetical protein